MINRIDTLIEVVNDSLAWADKYQRETFPREEFKEYRRRLRRFKNSLADNCSMAAYGESQVGKSYLMNSLLSTPAAPFVIENAGKTYSFIDELNPSGGNTAKTESTGVVTRFTLNADNPHMSEYVKIKNLTPADIVMLLADSYYNDLKIDTSRVLRYDIINENLKKIQALADMSYNQHYLTEDDVKDICDYIRDTVGGLAAPIEQSDFRKLVPGLISHIKPENWVQVFSLLWNCNEELNRLFSKLVSEYALLGFRTTVYVPFTAVMRDHGTLLKIEWLDSIFSATPGNENDVPCTDVYDAKGSLVAERFPKSILSALIAELTFVLPEKVAEERRFLEKVDLMDFPGARSREKINEQEVSTMLPTILRRGKVAYLFNKYSRSLSISGVLFCHHNDQKSEPTLGETIASWINDNIGSSQAERTKSLAATNGISPLFMVATKFNMELERKKTDNPDNAEMLSEHWGRFRTVIPEIIKPATWFDKWVNRGDIFPSEAFQSIYLLRDYYWSGKNRVFDGYSEGANPTPETGVHIHEDYPQYWERLRESFVGNDFVKSHFHNPAEAWESVATPRRDGSREIIRDLDAISGVIDKARLDRYSRQTEDIAKELHSKLSVYYEPEDTEQNNERLRTIIRNIRLSLDRNVGANQENFGRIIDRMMIPTDTLRKISYDVAVLHVEVPIDTDEIIMVRAMAGIEANDSADIARNKLCNYYLCEPDELAGLLKSQGLDLEHVIRGTEDLNSTVAEIISKRIVESWIAHINSRTAELEELIPHSDQVSFMLQTLCLRLGVKKKIASKIDAYTRVFSEEDLPNAIADFASLTLNNFVSSVGRDYLSPEINRSIDDKAKNCKIAIVDQSNGASTAKNDLVTALKAFDDARGSSVPLTTLMKLPFWNNYQHWKSNLMRGLICVSDISCADPEANKSIHEIMERIN